MEHKVSSALQYPNAHLLAFHQSVDFTRTCKPHLTAIYPWVNRNPHSVKVAYTPDSIWRNRSTFLQGRDEIAEFLTQKWAKENGYRLRKELFAFTDEKVCDCCSYLTHDERYSNLFSAHSTTNDRFLEAIYNHVFNKADCSPILV